MVQPMNKARIYRPDKNAMQSGRAKTKKWLLEFVAQKPYFTDNLMGWTGMNETQTEVHLRFATKQEAIAYAEKNRIAYEVYEPNSRATLRKAYADNFKYDKISG